LFYSKGFLILEKLVSKDHIPNQGFNPEDVATVATFKIYSKNNSTYTAAPLLINQNGNLFSLPDTVTSENIILRINKIENDKVETGIKESNTVMQYVTLKAYKFPFINILWLGIIITATGIIISMVRRIQLNRLKADKLSF
jgi:cytochrome c-type biogenesis protein CcmF